VRNRIKRKKFTEKIIDKITIYAEYELGINQLKKNKIKDLQ
jgi:hypothetical protein